MLWKEQDIISVVHHELFLREQHTVGPDFTANTQVGSLNSKASPWILQTPYTDTFLHEGLLCPAARLCGSYSARKIICKLMWWYTQHWHPGALLCPKVNMCGKMHPCCVVGRNVWANVLCPMQPGWGPNRGCGSLQHTPKVWTAKGQAGRHRAEPPAPWVDVQELRLQV